MRYSHSSRGGGSENVIFEKNLMTRTNDTIKENVIDDKQDVDDSPPKNDQSNDTINHNLYNELSIEDLFGDSRQNSQSTSTQDKTKGTQNQTKKKQVKEMDENNTPPQDIIKELKVTVTDNSNNSINSNFSTLSSLPQFKKKLNTLDEALIRTIYYLLFQQKSRSLDLIAVKDMILQFTGFTYNTELMKQKLFINPGLWSKDKLMALANLFSLDAAGTRQDMINKIITFLSSGSEPSSSQSSPSESSTVSISVSDAVVIEAIEIAEDDQSTPGQAVIARLGDIQSFQQRLDTLPVNKMLKSLCYIMTNTKNKSASSIKPAISDFQGFHMDSDFDGLKERMILNAGQWSLMSLQEACNLFNLDDEGTRPVLVNRLVDYLRQFSENKLKSNFIIKKSTQKTFLVTEDDVEEELKKRKKIVENTDDSDQEIKKKMKLNIKAVTAAAADEYVFLNHGDGDCNTHGTPNNSDDEDDGNNNFELMSDGTMEE